MAVANLNWNNISSNDIKLGKNVSINLIFVAALRSSLKKIIANQCDKTAQIIDLFTNKFEFPAWEKVWNHCSKGRLLKIYIKVLRRMYRNPYFKRFQRLQPVEALEDYIKFEAFKRWSATFWRHCVSVYVADQSSSNQILVHIL